MNDTLLIGGEILSLIQIAICEDDPADLNILKQYLWRFEKEKGCSFSLQTFDNPIPLLENYTAKYDLIIMDIAMSYMNGMEGAHRLRKLDSKVNLVFVTNLASYAIEGYSVSALDYILKPVSYFDFSLKMARVLRNVLETRQDYVLIPSRFSSTCLPLYEILYIETKGHQVIYHTAQQDYEQYTSLISLEKQLAGKHFSKCSSSYLVNLAYVKKVEGFTALVGDEEIQLQISHGRKAQFLADYHEYWKERCP